MVRKRCSENNLKEVSNNYKQKRLTFQGPMAAGCNVRLGGRDATTKADGEGTRQPNTHIK